MIICLECHKTFKNLTGHVKRKHGINIFEYRQKHSYSGPIIDKEIIDILSQNSRNRKGKPRSEAQKNVMIKMNNATKGKQKTLEHRLKISLTVSQNHHNKGKHLSDETKQKMSKSLTGRHHTEQTKRKIAEKRGSLHHLFGTHLSKQHKEKLSIIQSNKIKNNPNYSKGKYFSEKTHKTFYYKSSWELIVMKYLDRHPLVTNWKYEPFFIIYKDEYGRKRRFTPDFLVEIDEAINEIWEVKPRYQFESENEFISWTNKCKLNYLQIFAEKNDYEVRLICEEEIRIIKNINWDEIDKKYGDQE